MKKLLIYSAIAILTACSPEEKSDTSNAKTQFVSTCTIENTVYAIIRTSDIPTDAVVQVALMTWPDVTYDSKTLKVNNGEQTVTLIGECAENRQLVLYINKEPRNATSLDCIECEN